MEHALNSPGVSPNSAPATPHVAASASARAVSTAATRDAFRRVSVAVVWRDALSTFSAHSVVILFCAFIGFAVPAIVGDWLSTSANLSAYARSHSVVTLYNKPSLSTLLIQAGWGLLALTFARGAITWLALYGKGHGSFGAACRATLVQFPALLIGSLLYGVVIAASIIAMSALTHGLAFPPNKMAHVWAGPSRAFSDVLRQLSWHGLNLLAPNPGSPFTEFMPGVRQAISRHLTLLTALGGLLTLVIAETLLRFRTITVLVSEKTQRLSRFTALAPLRDSALLGRRCFGTITLHIWLMRLTLFAVTVALVEFPVAIVDQFIAPNVIHLGVHYEILHVMKFAAAAGSTLVSAILLALSVVYDARLYAALTGQVGRLCRAGG